MARKKQRHRQDKKHRVVLVPAGAGDKKELPFVVGVLGDFGGDSKATRPLDERKFVEIDCDNLEEVMARLAPALRGLSVENRLQPGSGRLAVDVDFEKIADFEPAQVAQDVEPLRRLLAVRERLKEMIDLAGRSENFRQELRLLLPNVERPEDFTEDAETEDASTGSSDSQ